MTPDTASVRIIAPSIGQAAAFARALRGLGLKGPISYAEPGPHDPAATPADGDEEVAA